MHSWGSPKTPWEGHLFRSLALGILVLPGLLLNPLHSPHPLPEAAAGWRLEMLGQGRGARGRSLLMFMDSGSRKWQLLS